MPPAVGSPSDGHEDSCILRKADSMEFGGELESDELSMHNWEERTLKAVQEVRVWNVHLKSTDLVPLLFFSMTLACDAVCITLLIVLN